MKKVEKIVLNSIGSSCSRKSLALTKACGPLSSCVWSLPKLQMLLVAGNGLTGYLPGENASISKELAYVNIGYNTIRGTISDSIANHPFDEFSIDSNMITGYLKLVSPPANMDGSRYVASVNRFSGKFSQMLEQ